MTIGGVNISTYGLQLLSVTDWQNQPARKKVLQEPVFAANDLSYEAGYLNVELFGHFTTEATMAIYLENLKDKIQSAFSHAIVIAEYGISVTGVFAEGVNFEQVRNNVKVKMKITIV
jgi:hypothetical protein